MCGKTLGNILEGLDVRKSLQAFILLEKPLPQSPKKLIKCLASQIHRNDAVQKGKDITLNSAEIKIVRTRAQTIHRRVFPLGYQLSMTELFLQRPAHGHGLVPIKCSSKALFPTLQWYVQIYFIQNLIIASPDSVVGPFNDTKWI